MGYGSRKKTEKKLTKVMVLIYFPGCVPSYAIVTTKALEAEGFLKLKLAEPRVWERRVIMGFITSQSKIAAKIGKKFLA